LPAPDLLAEGEELVAGRRPVEEAFVARRAAIRLLVVPQRRMALEKIVLHATSLRIPIVEVEGGSLTSLAGFDGHQGVALVVGPRHYATIDDVVARAKDRGEPPLILVLDSLEDPQNVGTLLRSAEAVGVHGVLFPTHRQAPLSPAAVKASAGAVEHLLLVPVDDLPGALADLHVRGLRIAGADGDAPLPARQADLRGPLALVVGSEGQGLGPAVRRRADFLVRIPMRGIVGSLNAAVAGSVLLFEVLAQRDPLGESTSQPAPRAVAVEPPAAAAEPSAAAEAATPPASRRPRAPRPVDSGAEGATEAAPSVPPTAGKPTRRTRRTPAEQPETHVEPQAATEPPVTKPTRTRRPRASAADEGGDPDLLPGGPNPGPSASAGSPS
jgi:23S rRNA (guanosine2251-2'-O)-methyltransferase